MDRKEYLKIYSKKYRENNKEYFIKYNRNWCLNNKEKRLEYRKKYILENKDIINKKRNEYRHRTGQRVGYHRKLNGIYISKTKEYARIKTHNRRIMVKKSGRITIYLLQKIYENNIKKYGTLTCYLCLLPIEFGNDNLEHKIPLSRGGDNKFENLEISCSNCNKRKNNKTEEEYRKVMSYAPLTSIKVKRK